MVLVCSVGVLAVEAMIIAAFLRRKGVNDSTATKRREFTAEEKEPGPEYSGLRFGSSFKLP